MKILNYSYTFLQKFKSVFFIFLIFWVSVGYSEEMCTQDKFQNRQFLCASGRSYGGTCISCRFINDTEMKCTCRPLPLGAIININDSQCRETNIEKVDIVNHNGQLECARSKR